MCGVFCDDAQLELVLKGPRDVSHIVYLRFVHRRGEGAAG